MPGPHELASFITLTLADDADGIDDDPLWEQEEQMYRWLFFVAPQEAVEPRGTGFFLSQTCAITAWHVLPEAKVGDRVHCGTIVARPKPAVSGANPQQHRPAGDAKDEEHVDASFLSNDSDSVSDCADRERVTFALEVAFVRPDRDYVILRVIRDAPVPFPVHHFPVCEKVPFDTPRGFRVVAFQCIRKKVAGGSFEDGVVEISAATLPSRSRGLKHLFMLNGVTVFHRESGCPVVLKDGKVVGMIVRGLAYSAEGAPAFVYAIKCEAFHRYSRS